jgi:DNA-binding NtrC family response regulator
MPVMNGLETLKELKKRKINVNVIIISADSSIENEALAQGAVSFFEKPVDIQNLLEILNDIFLVESTK